MLWSAVLSVVVGWLRFPSCTAPQEAEILPKHATASSSAHPSLNRGVNRTAMSFCFYGAHVAPILGRFIDQSRSSLEKNQPYKLPRTKVDISVLTVDNILVYGLQNAYLRDGTTLQCNATALNVWLNAGIKEMRAAVDWKVKHVYLNGKAELSFDALEADVKAVIPAPKESRIVVESVKIVSIEGARMRMLGPLIFNVLVTPNEQSVTEYLEYFSMLVVQKYVENQVWPF
ncbi:uncharacterized protein LOC135366280 [Ornithodoros turicata]|uniref:uncharacterized protein LOC135366280 n=1 Tax=Ornithodoros turicata TaxID=34597 RepID=UPI003139D539